jgi:PDZ domain-containing secreted protein
MIAGGVLAFLLVLGIGAAAGAGITYAAMRGHRDGRSVTIRLDDDHGPVIPSEARNLKGIVIGSVVDGGPADQAGVVRGDVLLQVNGETISDFAELMAILDGHERGDEVQLTVSHGDDERTLTVTLGERDGMAYLGIVPCMDALWPAPVVTAHAEGPTVIVYVEPDSPAEEAGLQEGDVIVAVDGQELSPERSLAEVVASHKPGDKVTLEVQPSEGEQESREVTVTLGEHPDEKGVAYLGVRYRAFTPARVGVRLGVPFEWGPFGRHRDFVEPVPMPHFEFDCNSCCDCDEH